MSSITSRRWLKAWSLFFLCVLAAVTYSTWDIPLTAYFYLAPSAESTFAKRCLKSRSARIRCAAAHHLGRIGPNAKSALPDLLVAMNASPEVASTAAWAVGTIGFVSPSSESIVALAKQINHANGEIRRYSAYSLGLCGRRLFESDLALFESTLIPALVGKLDDPDMSNGAAQALGMIGSLAVPTVKDLTRSSDSRLKSLAANAVMSLEGHDSR